MNNNLSREYKKERGIVSQNLKPREGQRVGSEKQRSGGCNTTTASLRIF